MGNSSEMLRIVIDIPVTSNDVGENNLRKHSKKSSRLNSIKCALHQLIPLIIADFPLDFASSTILAPVCATRFGCL
jgi:hypothetical protein